MKNLLALTMIALLFVQCNQYTENAQKAQMRNDSLQRLLVEKDSAIFAVLNTFSAIENNLETIKSKENIISLTVKNVEDTQSREEQINEEINAIYDLMLDNKEKLAKLQNQLKQAHIKNNDLQKTIASLQEKLAEKNSEIITMRGDLLRMNLKIDELSYTLDTLKFESEVKTAIIESQEESLNTAYYLFGTERELKDLKIIDAKGKFIGIGFGTNLNADFDKELFTSIDIREHTKFTFNAKKINLISKHPSASYQVYGEKPVDSLLIKDPDAFWSVSKYLIIVLD
jgi:cation transport regulator ChaC